MTGAIFRQSLVLAERRAWHPMIELIASAPHGTTRVVVFARRGFTSAKTSHTGNGFTMTRIGPWLAFGVITILAAIQTTTAGAAEVTVLSASAVHAVVTRLAGTFQRETGHTVRPAFATAGQVARRVTTGEATDIVIALDGAMEQMAGHGLVVQDSRTVIARVGAGVGVPEGAIKPHISSFPAIMPPYRRS